MGKERGLKLTGQVKGKKLARSWKGTACLGVWITEKKKSHKPHAGLISREGRVVDLITPTSVEVKGRFETLSPKSKRQRKGKGIII